MVHEKRVWCVRPAESPEQLARDLVEHSWTLCTGFELSGYWFLNDAFGEDSAQEYGIVKKAGPDGTPVQVESITFSWCSYEGALRHILATLAGEYDDGAVQISCAPAVQTPDEHGCCHLCA